MAAAKAPKQAAPQAQAAAKAFSMANSAWVTPKPYGAMVPPAAPKPPAANPNGIYGGWMPPGNGIYGMNPNMGQAAPATPGAPGGGGPGDGGGSGAAPSGGSVDHVAPYLRPDQALAQNAYLTSANQQLIDSQNTYDQLAASTHAQAGDQAGGKLDNSGLIYHQMQQNMDAANNALIARGLFQSSIRDGNLADIEATANNSRMALLNSLAIQAAANNQTRLNVQAGINNYQSEANRLAAQNALDDESQKPPPDASTADPAPSPAAPSGGIAPVNASDSLPDQWAQAFRNTHGGADVGVYNYLQALYHANNG